MYFAGYVNMVGREDHHKARKRSVDHFMHQGQPHLGQNFAQRRYQSQQQLLQPTIHSQQHFENNDLDPFRSLRRRQQPEVGCSCLL